MTLLTLRIDRHTVLTGAITFRSLNDYGKKLIMRELIFCS